jgi:hypothetical protein
MGSRGGCYDNAMFESSNATLEYDRLHSSRGDLAGQLRVPGTSSGLKSKSKTIHEAGST